MASVWHSGIEIDYRVKGTGTPVIFLHGMGGSSSQCEALLDPIDHVRFILPDLRGHGGTELGPVEDLSFGKMAEDVAALWDALRLKRVVLGGISMGAAVSIAAALRFPDRVEKLILLRPAWIDRPMPEEICIWYQMLADALRRGSPEQMEKDPVFQKIRKHRDTAQIFLNAFQDPASLKWPEKFERLPAQRPVESLEKLRGLCIPALVLADRGDPIHRFSYAEAYAAALPNGFLTEVPAKGERFLQYRQAVNAAIQDFLIKK